MGIQFEKVKKKYFPTNRPIPVKQGRVRGNKNIFKAGLKHAKLNMLALFMHQILHSIAINPYSDPTSFYDT